MASLKFAVQPVYGTELVGSDSPKIEWGKIELVTTHLDLDDTCPICLEYPCCPRLTLCGHIFCLPCLFHLAGRGHQHLVGSVVTCPLCNYKFGMETLLRLRTAPLREVKGGTRIRFALLTKPRDQPGSGLRAVVTPCTQHPQDLPPLFGTPAAQFNRLSIVDWDGIHKSAREELGELNERLSLVTATVNDRKLSRIEQVDEIKWLEESVRLLQKEMEQKEQMGKDPTYTGAMSMLQQAARGAVIKEYELPGATGAPTSPTGRPSRRAALPQEVLLKSEKMAASDFLFQENSGAPLFVDPLDVEVILAEYQSKMEGGDDMCKVRTFLDGAAVKTQELMIRDLAQGSDLGRHLGHLEPWVEVRVVTLDLSKIVSAPILESFAERIAQRDADWSTIFTTKPPPASERQKKEGVKKKILLEVEGAAPAASGC